MGRLAGIARHAERRGPIETLDLVAVTVERGVEGCCRGIVRPNSGNRRQVTMIEAGDWADAIAEIGADLPWWARRANLLVEDFDLPQGGDVRVRIGVDVVIELKVEIEPCERMDALVPGLRRALEPDWRGGVGGRVISGGTIAVGDEIRVEPTPVRPE